MALPRGDIDGPDTHRGASETGAKTTVDESPNPVPNRTHFAIGAQKTENGNLP
jgi:hypothetical protein